LRAGAPEGTQPELPGLGEAAERVARLEPGRLDVRPREARAASPGARPGLDHQLEQQAGARLPRARVDVELQLAVPLADAGDTAEDEAARRAQGGRAGRDRLDGGRRDDRLPRDLRRAMGAEGARQAEGPEGRRRDREAE